MRWFTHERRAFIEKGKKMALFQINRSEWISLDEQYRIQYFTFRGGKSEWVISRKDGKYFSALASATDLASAKIKYCELVGA
jgi:hypothetical protein